MNYSNKNNLYQLPTGTLLKDRYEIVRVTGQGGFGITYEGWDKVLNLQVAVKEYFPMNVVSRNSLSTPKVTPVSDDNASEFIKGREKFLQEARVLAKYTREPSVVNIRDFFEENNTAYIVMEYLEGHNLKEEIDRGGPMTFERALLLISPIMHVLAKIHQDGLIHRDISPANLVMVDDRHVKLIDFGTARQSSIHGDESISVMLKPGYSPEEQYNSHGNQGPWTDVYALCGTLYKLITGVTPENSVNRILGHEISKPSELGAVISPAEEDVLLRGMSVKADERIQTMDELISAFTQASSSSETIADETIADEEITISGPEQIRRDDPTPITVKEKTDRNNRKSRKPIVMIATLTAAAIIVICLLTLLPKHVSDEYGSASYRDTTISESMIRDICSDKKLTSLKLTNCEISDDMLSQVGQEEHIERVTLDNCSGFSGISELKSQRNISLCTDTLVDDRMIPEDLPALETFSVSESTISDMSSLGHMPSLISLELFKCDIKGRQTLPELPKLTYVNVFSTDFGDTDLSSLRVASGLKYFKMAGCNLHTISFLEGTTLLETVDVSSNNVSDISPLKGNEQMRSLIFSDNDVEDISAIGNMTAITTLEMSKNRIKDLDSCELLINIESLVSGSNQIADINGLKNTSLIETLDLSNNQITDISPIAGNAPNLNTIILGGNKIDDISVVSGCVELKTLDIANNEIKSLDPLRNQSTITFLSACGNQIRKIDGISECTSLVFADLGENDIESLDGLSSAGETNMVLLLQNNRISDFASLDPSKKYRGLSIYGNPVKDLTFISELAGANDDSTLYIPWVDDMDADVLSSAGRNGKVTIVDVPLDKQAMLREEYKNNGNYRKLNFKSSKQADDEIDDLRNETREALTD